MVTFSQGLGVRTWASGEGWEVILSIVPLNKRNIYIFFLSKPKEVFFFAEEFKVL